jgi:hypothetical protein
MSRLYTSASGRFVVDLLSGIECRVTDTRTGRSRDVTGTSAGMALAHWLERNCSDMPAVRPAARDDLTNHRRRRDHQRQGLRLVGGTVAGKRSGDSLIAQLADRRFAKHRPWPTSPTGGDAA